MKRFLSILLALSMCMALCIPAFATDVQGGDIRTPDAARALSVVDSSFVMQKITITPVVVSPGSTMKLALKAYSETTSITGSSSVKTMYWDSYKMSGFIQYVLDNDYQMAGWDISLTGKYTVKSVVGANDKLKYFEYNIDDGPSVRKDIQYSANKVVTYSWFAPIEGDLTKNTDVTSRFNWTVIYTDGVTNKTRERTGRMTVMMTYWPEYV